MTNEIVELTPEDVLSWFDKSENFKYLPQDIQDKIVRFFTDQPVTAVNSAEIKDFLKFGRNFTVYYGYEEFMNALDLSSTKAILTCKANFDNFDDAVVWFESFQPKLIKSIPPSEERIQKVRQKYGAEKNNKHDKTFNYGVTDLFILTETQHIYEHDVYVAPMFNTMGYLDIEFYVASR